MAEKRDEFKRVLPASDLDFNMLTTDSEWGKPSITPELKEKLELLFQERNQAGELSISKSSLWGLMSFYTRDMRLGNLDELELDYCQYYIDLAGDFLEVDMVKPFIKALSLAATRIELSQSKKGFLRKRMGTLTTESTHRELEPPKKSLFGFNNKREG